MKILLIGAGRWGQNHLRTLKELGVDVYLSDLDSNYLEGHSPSSVNYRDFLYAVDGAVIATPADSHYAIATECLKAGKDVFIEKPMAITLEEAKLLMWKTYGSILQVGHIYRYHPATQKIAEIIREGGLGNIKYAYGHFMRFKRPRTDVGVTQTDAIHYFDLFNYLFGEPPQTVMSHIAHHLGLPLDDTSISILDYHGIQVLIEVGCMPPEDKRDIVIIGDKASLYCDFKQNSLVLHDNHHVGQTAVEGNKQIYCLSSEEPLTIELIDFMSCVADRSRPLADGKAGYEALRVVEACHKSAKTGERVSL